MLRVFLPPGNALDPESDNEEVRMKSLKQAILGTCTVCGATILGTLAVVTAGTLIWVSMI